MNIHVQRGTNAGRKKSYLGRAADWYCDCVIRRELLFDGWATTFKQQPGYLVRCTDCGAGRDCLPARN